MSTATGFQELANEISRDIDRAVIERVGISTPARARVAAGYYTITHDGATGSDGVKIVDAALARPGHKSLVFGGESFPEGHVHNGKIRQFALEYVTACGQPLYVT